jgi:hypothetical protein
MLLMFKASFQTGLIATKAERLTTALQGAQNEFREHSAQTEASVEIADWIKSVRGLHPVLMAVFLALSITGVVGATSIGSTTESRQLRR